MSKAQRIKKKNPDGPSPRANIRNQIPLQVQDISRLTQEGDDEGDDAAHDGPIAGVAEGVHLELLVTKITQKMLRKILTDCSLQMRE